MDLMGIYHVTKGVPELNVEDGVWGNLAPPGDLEESASHRIAQEHQHMTRRASTVCLYSKSNTGAGDIDRPMQPEHCPDLGCFVGFVREILLWDLHETFRDHRYMYDLVSDKRACPLIHCVTSLY